MDGLNFDRLTALLSSGSNRRRAIASFVAGTGAAFGTRMSIGAKQRKKRCMFCPQQTCCSCSAIPQGQATTCFLIEGLSKEDAQARCTAACGGSDLRIVVNTPFPGAANFCKSDHTCGVKSCPIPV